MFKKLYRSFIDRQKLYDDYVETIAKLTTQTSENFTLLWEVEQLENSMQALKKSQKGTFKVADLDFIDDTPEDTDAFKAYAGRVGEFYEDIMDQKLRDNIAKTRGQMADVVKIPQVQTDTRGEYDWFLRGMEAAFWSMREWGTEMSAQRKIDLQEAENNKN